MIYLAGRQITYHFFVLPNDKGGHDILLGIPFFKDTHLTDFKAGRLISANVTMADKIIKAYIVSKETVRRSTASH